MVSRSILTPCPQGLLVRRRGETQSTHRPQNTCRCQVTRSALSGGGFQRRRDNVTEASLASRIRRWFGIRETGIQVWHFPFLGCETLGKSLHLSEPQFPHLGNGSNSGVV